MHGIFCAENLFNKNKNIRKLKKNVKKNKTGKPHKYWGFTKKFKKSTRNCSKIVLLKINTKNAINTYVNECWLGVVPLRNQTRRVYRFMKKTIKKAYCCRFNTYFSNGTRSLRQLK